MVGLQIAPEVFSVATCLWHAGLTLGALAVGGGVGRVQMQGAQDAGGRRCMGQKMLGGPKMYGGLKHTKSKLAVCLDQSRTAAHPEQPQEDCANHGCHVRSVRSSILVMIGSGTRNG